MKPHVHAEAIKAWADGATIQCLTDTKWQDIRTPMWSSATQYRIKPERVFPKTTLTYTELYASFSASGDGSGLLCVANAAIKQYILDTEKDVSVS